MFRYTLLFLSLFSFQLVHAQTDSIPDSIHAKQKQNYGFRYHQLIIPAIAIGYGFMGIENDGVKSINSEVKEEVNENIDEKITIDDFTQHAPGAAVYVLNLSGIKGEHNFKDRTIILGTAHLLMTASVIGIKSVTKVQRPDGTSKNSFPSGHTATAFANAEFLYREYKDVSPWYGVAGFVVAAGTGAFRVYNDRHWVTDVVAGAGIGILSAKAAYWLHPYMKRLFTSSKKPVFNGAILPYYHDKKAGVGMVMVF